MIGLKKILTLLATYTDNNPPYQVDDVVYVLANSIGEEQIVKMARQVNLHITEEGIFSTLPPSLAKEVSLAVLHWISLSNL